MVDHEGTLQIEYDDISMKTELISTRFAGNFGKLGFDKNCFLLKKKTLLGFTTYWGSKSANAVHADKPDVYTSDKILNLSTIDKIHLKSDVLDGSILNDLQTDSFFSFILDKQTGYIAFHQPETLHSKKVNKLVLNTLTF